MTDQVIEFINNYFINDNPYTSAQYEGIIVTFKSVIKEGNYKIVESYVKSMYQNLNVDQRRKVDIFFYACTAFSH